MSGTILHDIPEEVNITEAAYYNENRDWIVNNKNDNWGFIKLYENSDDCVVGEDTVDT